MSSCYKVSDNKHFGCPARMSDGRHFTDYAPNCETEMQLRNTNGVMNSFEYRIWLQKNADVLMNNNRNVACVRNCCAGSCVENFDGGTMLPEKYIVKCDANTCTRVLADPAGLGDGRAYFTSPPTCKGLPASWPQQKNDNSCATPEDNFFYYGDMQHSGQLLRPAMPKGGVGLTGGDNRVYK
jgi:hypothetical protein